MRLCLGFKIVWFAFILWLQAALAQGQALPDSLWKKVESKTRAEAYIKGFKDEMKRMADDSRRMEFFGSMVHAVDSLGGILGEPAFSPPERVLALALARQYEELRQAIDDSLFEAKFIYPYTIRYRLIDRELESALMRRALQDSAILRRELEALNLPADTRAFMRLVVWKMLDGEYYWGMRYSPDFSNEKRFLAQFPTSRYGARIMRQPYYFPRADDWGMGFSAWTGLDYAGGGIHRQFNAAILFGMAHEVMYRNWSGLIAVQWGQPGLKRNIDYKGVNWPFKSDVSTLSSYLAGGYTVAEGSLNKDVGWRLMPVLGAGVLYMGPKLWDYNHRREMEVFIQNQGAVMGGFVLDLWAGKRNRPGTVMSPKTPANVVGSTQIRYMFSYGLGRDKYLLGPMAWHTVGIGVSLNGRFVKQPQRAMPYYHRARRAKRAAMRAKSR